MDAYFNLLDYVTHGSQLVRDYIPALTCVMGQSMFDRTASTVGMVTGEKSRQGFVCEIRAAMVFILCYGLVLIRVTQYNKFAGIYFSNADEDTYLYM